MVQELLQSAGLEVLSSEAQDVSICSEGLKVQPGGSSVPENGIIPAGSIPDGSMPDVRDLPDVGSMPDYGSILSKHSQAPALSPIQGPFLAPLAAESPLQKAGPQRAGRVVTHRKQNTSFSCLLFSPTHFMR